MEHTLFACHHCRIIKFNPLAILDHLGHCFLKIAICLMDTETDIIVIYFKHIITFTIVLLLAPHVSKALIFNCPSNNIYSRITSDDKKVR